MFDLTRALPAVVLGICLGACGLVSSPSDRAARQSPSFKEGYGDGCAAATATSANYREGPYRDNALYNSDKLYRAGWASGYQSCNPRPAQVPGANPIGGSVMPGH